MRASCRCRLPCNGWKSIGGWPEGDATFTGPNRPTGAFMPYYQRSRHIYGDLKIEIFDAQGKLVDTVATSKHRGVNRATWSMHLKPPMVPPAATAAFGAAIGPRVLPGAYTVKMTRGDKVYTAQLNVVLDPRAKFTVEDRSAQFDLVNKLAALLNHMSWAVDAIIGVARRARARKENARASPPPPTSSARRSSPPRKAARSPAKSASANSLAGLYGDVNGYEGRPTNSQVARADALAPRTRGRDPGIPRVSRPERQRHPGAQRRRVEEGASVGGCRGPSRRSAQRPWMGRVAVWRSGSSRLSRQSRAGLFFHRK